MISLSGKRAGQGPSLIVHMHRIVSRCTFFGYIHIHIAFMIKKSVLGLGFFDAPATFSLNHWDLSAALLASPKGSTVCGGQTLRHDNVFQDLRRLREAMLGYRQTSANGQVPEGRKSSPLFPSPTRGGS